MNLQDQDGTSPLHYATLNGHAEIAKLLIENGAEVNLQDQNGTSSLNYAIINDNTEIAKLLIKQGAEVDDITLLGYGDTYSDIATLASDLTDDTTLDLTNSNLNKYQLAAIALDSAQQFNQSAIEVAPLIINNPNITRLFLLNDHMQTKLIELVNGREAGVETKLAILSKIANNLELCTEPSSNNIDIINKAFEIAETFQKNNGNLSTPADYTIFANMLNALLNPNLLEQQYDDLCALSLTSKEFNQTLGGRATFKSSLDNSHEYPQLGGVPADVLKLIGKHIAADFNISQLPEIDSLLKLHQAAGHLPKNNLENERILENISRDVKENITTPRENSNTGTYPAEESKQSRTVDEIERTIG